MRSNDDIDDDDEKEEEAEEEEEVEERKIDGVEWWISSSKTPVKRWLSIINSQVISETSAAKLTESNLVL